MTNDTKGKRKSKSQGSDPGATEELASFDLASSLTGSPDDRRRSSFAGSPDDR